MILYESFHWCTQNPSYGEAKGLGRFGQFFVEIMGYGTDKMYGQLGVVGHYIAEEESGKFPNKQRVDGRFCAMLV